MTGNPFGLQSHLFSREVMWNAFGSKHSLGMVFVVSTYEESNLEEQYQESNLVEEYQESNLEEKYQESNLEEKYFPVKKESWSKITPQSVEEILSTVKEVIDQMKHYDFGASFASCFSEMFPNTDLPRVHLDTKLSATGGGNCHNFASLLAQRVRIPSCR